jgi:hypothetical protein
MSNNVNTIAHSVNGRLYVREGQYGLLLDEAAESVLLRYALLTQGEEQPFFPRLLLDDWGNEIRGRSLYQWVRDNALRFPRAELFGLDIAGNETQYFLRDLENVEPFPCYAYPDTALHLSKGLLLKRVFLADAGATQPLKIKCPQEQETPLCLARLSWWRVAPDVLVAHKFHPM